MKTITREYFKNYKHITILIPLLILLSYGYLTACGNIRVDLEVLINNPGTTYNWMEIGRFGLVFLEKSLGLDVYNKFYFFALFFVFYTLANEFLIWGMYVTSDGNKKIPYGIIAGLLCTSNIYAFQFYFTLQQGEIALGFLLTVICAIVNVNIFLRNAKIHYYLCTIATIPVLIICFGTYQAFVEYYICLCMIFALLRVDAMRKNPKQKIRNGQLIAKLCSIVFLFLITYIVYSMIVDYVGLAEYINGQVSYGSHPLTETIFSIVLAIGKQALGVKAARFSYYFVDCLMLLYVIWSCHKRKRNGNAYCNQLGAGLIDVIRVLIILGIMLSPFLLIIYKGGEQYIRAIFSLQLVAAFMAGYMIYLLKNRYMVQNLIVTKYLPIAYITVQLLLCMQLAYTDYVRYQNDVKMALRFQEIREEKSIDEKKPVVFIGEKTAELNVFCNKIDTFGASMWEWDYDSNNPEGVTNRACGMLNAYGVFAVKGQMMSEEVLKVKEELAMTKVFPEKESVVELDEIVVVKLDYE